MKMFEEVKKNGRTIDDIFNHIEKYRKAISKGTLDKPGFQYDPLLKTFCDYFDELPEEEQANYQTDYDEISKEYQSRKEQYRDRLNPSTREWLRENWIDNFYARQLAHAQTNLTKILPQEQFLDIILDNDELYSQFLALEFETDLARFFNDCVAQPKLTWKAEIISLFRSQGATEDHLQSLRGILDRLWDITNRSKFQETKDEDITASAASFLTSSLSFKMIGWIAASATGVELPLATLMLIRSVASSIWTDFSYSFKKVSDQNYPSILKPSVFAALIVQHQADFNSLLSTLEHDLYDFEQSVEDAELVNSDLKLWGNMAIGYKLFSFLEENSSVLNSIAGFILHRQLLGAMNVHDCPHPLMSAEVEALSAQSTERPSFFRRLCPW